MPQDEHDSPHGNLPDIEGKEHLISPNMSFGQLIRWLRYLYGNYALIGTQNAPDSLLSPVTMEALANAMSSPTNNRNPYQIKQQALGEIETDIISPKDPGEFINSLSNALRMPNELRLLCAQVYLNTVRNEKLGASFGEDVGGLLHLDPTIDAYRQVGSTVNRLFPNTPATSIYRPRRRQTH